MPTSPHSRVIRANASPVAFPTPASQGSKARETISTPKISISCTASSGTPPAITGSGHPDHPLDNICDGVYQGYLEAFSDTSIFPVSASEGNEQTAAQYISDAYHNGYTIPSNGYGAIQGAGRYFAPGFEAACAAMGAMGWSQSNYWTSGDSPDTAGNILMNWYNTYFSGIVSTSTMSNASKPSCCGTTG